MNYLFRYSIDTYDNSPLCRIPRTSKDGAYLLLIKRTRMRDALSIAAALYCRRWIRLPAQRGRGRIHPDRHFPAPTWKRYRSVQNLHLVPTTLPVPQSPHRMWSPNPTMKQDSELTKLANLITSSLATLQEEWRLSDIPEPSLNPSSPTPPAFISVKADKASRTILGASKMLSVLVAGPLRWSTWQTQEVSWLRCGL